MGTAVVSGRVDEAVKRKADAVIRRYGCTTNDVIKNVWQSIAQTQELPDMHMVEDERAAAARAMRELREFTDSLQPCPVLATLSDDDVKEMMKARRV